MPDALPPDWESFLRHRDKAGINELDLRTLQAGDRLLVITQHTSYGFVMITPHEAMLTSSRSDRPSGHVRINGCTFGASSSIKPDHVFCGGNLEFVRSEGGQIYTTTEIRGLQLVQAARAQA